MDRISACSAELTTGGILDEGQKSQKDRQNSGFLRCGARRIWNEKINVLWDAWFLLDVSQESYQANYEAPATFNFVVAADRAPNPLCLMLEVDPP